MITDKELKGALGEADAHFDCRIRQTLAELEKQEEQPMKKRHVGLVVALCIVLIAAVALAAAARWGVLDFVDYTESWRGVLPEASELVQSDIAQTGGETSLCTFTLREAVADGTQAFLVVAVTPKDDRLLLIGPDMMETDAMLNLGPAYAGIEDSVAAWARTHHQRIAAVTIADHAISEGKRSILDSFNYVLEEDGTLVMMCQGACTQEQAAREITLRCIVSPRAETDSKDEEGSLTFTLTPAAVRWTAASTQPADFPQSGVRVDSVKLTSTALSTKMEIRYTVTDAAAYELMDDGLWFEALDAAGERIASGSGEVDAANDQESAFVQTVELTAMDKAPDSVTLRAYECWEKQRFDTQTITMK